MTLEEFEAGFELDSPVEVVKALSDKAFWDHKNDRKVKNPACHSRKFGEWVARHWSEVFPNEAPPAAGRSWQTGKRERKVYVTSAFDETPSHQEKQQ